MWSQNDSMLSIPSLLHSLCCIQKPIWPSLPLTTMANPSLIHLCVVLTRSPRLRQGSRSLGMEKGGDNFITSGGKLTDNPPQPDRIGQARPNQALSGDPLTTAASLLRWVINQPPQCNTPGASPVINMVLVGFKSSKLWPFHLSYVQLLLKQ